MLKEIAILVLLSISPIFELRGAIPVGILDGSVNLPFDLTLSGMGMPWYFVFAICVISNFIIGLLIYLFLDKLVHVFLRISWFNKFYHKVLERSQKKIHKSVEKYGNIGVALFIGIPLPGSGVYTGAIGAYAIGLGLRKFIIANLVGVLLAGTIVTALSLGILHF